VPAWPITAQSLPNSGTGTFPPPLTWPLFGTPKYRCGGDIRLQLCRSIVYDVTRNRFVTRVERLAESKMAAKVLFKQQCPHCDRSIPIKDAKLIGEETKCPKCKNPFVVEDPAEATDVKAKKMKTIDDAAGDSSAAEGEAAPKKGLPPMVLIGGSLAGVIVVLLILAAFFMRGKPSPGMTIAKGGGAGIGGRRPPAPKPEGQAEAAPAAKPKPKPESEEPAAVGSVGNPTNLLPNDSQAVLSVPVQELLHTPLGREVLTPPGAGVSPLEQRYGINVEDIDRWLVAANYAQDWLFHVVRTKKPVMEQVKRALHLKPAETTIEGQEYFVTQTNWLEGGNPFRIQEKGADAPTPSAPGTRPLAVRFCDAVTIVMGDLAPMQEFLKVKGHPQPRKGGGKGGEERHVTAFNYASLSPRLREMLERAESRPPVVAAFAIDLEGVSASASPWDKLPGRDWIDGLAVGLHMKDSISLAMEMPSRNKEDANQAIKAVSQALHRLEAWAKPFGVGLKITESLPSANAAAAPAAAPPDDGDDEMPFKRRRRRGGDQAAPTAPASTSKPGEIPTIAVALGLSGVNVMLQANVPTDQKLYDDLDAAMRPFLARPQGELVMMASRPDPNRFAAALHQYATDHRQFPPGLARRMPSPARANRPWHPNECVSWMAELLPYLGYDSTYAQINMQRSWRDPENVAAAVTIIPAFLSPDAPSTTWYARYPGLKYDVAATHYVGIAGVGEDAADYSASDRKQAGRIGVFGYERTTRLTDITDGLGNTIVVAQVPPVYQAPWIAGGGSTIRGVPEKNSIKPFLSTTFNGKRGTVVIMADGSARFISENISDEVFQSLCTIHGGEPKVNLDKTAPLLRPPEAEEEPGTVPRKAADASERPTKLTEAKNDKSRVDEKR
jgi:hypothetical protein